MRRRPKVPVVTRETGVLLSKDGNWFERRAHRLDDGAVVIISWMLGVGKDWDANTEDIVNFDAAELEVLKTLAP